jgi:hypothetical protein
LEPTEAAVLAEKAERGAAEINPDPFRLKKSCHHFYNTSPLDMAKHCLATRTTSRRTSFRISKASQHRFLHHSKVMQITGRSYRMGNSGKSSNSTT